MNRLIYILLACLCLTACHKSATTDNTTTDSSASVANDSIMTERVNEFMKEYVAAHKNMYYVNTATPSPVSDRLYEVWYDDGGYWVLVNRQDTSVTDFLKECPFLDATDFLSITDSTGIEWKKKSKYQERNDTLTIHEHTFFTFVDEMGRLDTMLHECSIITYNLFGDKFTKLSQLDTVIGGYDRTAKCYFNEFKYNDKLYALSKFIMAGDYISDEQLLDAMPKNEEQYHVYNPEHIPYNDRSLVIDSLAISRAKDNPLFRDAYIKMLQWSDAAPADAIRDYYCPRFYFYDSVYFNDAIRRNLPTLYDAIFDDEWYEWNYEHKDEIMNEQ